MSQRTKEGGGATCTRQISIRDDIATAYFVTDTCGTLCPTRIIKSGCRPGDSQAPVIRNPYPCRGARVHQRFGGGLCNLSGQRKILRTRSSTLLSAKCPVARIVAGQHFCSLGQSVTRTIGTHRPITTVTIIDNIHRSLTVVDQS